MPSYILFERIRELEVKLNLIQEKQDTLSKELQTIKEQTKNSRMFWYVIGKVNLPPQVVFIGFSVFTFGVAFIAELVIRATIVDEWIKQIHFH